MLFLGDSLPCRVARCAIGLLSATVIFGCSSAKSTSEAIGDGDEGSGPEPTENTISFLPSTTLTLAPSESATLTVEVTPRQRQDVIFEILTETDSFDGFLVDSVSRAREDGTAAVDLTAPTEPSTFRVRASLSGGPEALRAISVSSLGYGTIQVIPEYGGSRDIPQWTASARAGFCDDLITFFDDGPLVSIGSQTATIHTVPAGTPIAVTVRGAQLASGCATLLNLRADRTEELNVEVKDRPIDVSRGTLALVLDVDSVTTEFAEHLEQAIALGRTHFYGENETEGAVVLALMAEHLSDDERVSFEQAAADYSFAAEIDSLFENGAPLAGAISSVLTEAASAIAGEGVFLGELTLDSSSAQFLLTEAAGVPAALSGFFQGSTWMASVESEDTVVLGGALTYEPLRWLVAIAEHSPGSAPSDVLIAAARCDEIGTRLEEVAQEPPFEGCDEGCIESLCLDAVEPLWEGLRTTGGGLSTLQVAMSGAAQLSGAAQIESMGGSWLGRLGTDETSIRGPASANQVVK